MLYEVITDCGYQNMTNYLKYLNGFTDFTDLAFSNIKNGIGLIASRSSGMIDSLRFDYKTTQQLTNENRLKKLRLVSF